MTKKSILFLGASSDIGLSLANIFAKNGFNLMLASRDTKYLKIKSNEIKNQPVVGWFPNEFRREEGISCLQQENPKEELSIQ